MTDTINKLRQTCGPHAAEVRKSTGMSADDHARLIFDAGMEYLSLIDPDEAGIKRHYSQSKAFWNWFKLYWYSLDSDFLAKYDRRRVSPQYYKEHHLAQLITVLPDRVTYQLIKKEAA